MIMTDCVCMMMMMIKDGRSHGHIPERMGSSEETNQDGGVEGLSNMVVDRKRQEPRDLVLLVSPFVVERERVYSMVPTAR
jgi:hypothetical protein